VAVERAGGPSGGFKHLPWTDDDVGNQTHDGTRIGPLADAGKTARVDDVTETAGQSARRQINEMDPAATLVFAITVLITLDVVAARLAGSARHGARHR